MNPFEEKAPALTAGILPFADWDAWTYDENTDPYTKTRLILMNGTEFEQVWFMHQLLRHTDDPEIRERVSFLRRVEQQQQKCLSLRKPIRESILEHTIGYEQLAVDLTAALAREEPDETVRRALDFALLEDFDHLYRFADLLEAEEGVKAERLVGRYTEVTPGRPTIAHHRHPADCLRTPIGANASLRTKLCANIITAAEQQTMNYYMNVATFYRTDLGRRLYGEIAMVEEEHVSWYGSLLDPACTWLASLVMHEYTECYLYWSCLETETEPRFRSMWEAHLQEELSHLQEARALFEKKEKRSVQELLPDAAFPTPIRLQSNIPYVRQVLGETVENTSVGTAGYEKVDNLPRDSRFFTYQQAVCPDAQAVPSHRVIAAYIDNHGEDYRFETAENPVPSLRCRTEDNVSVGRCKTPAAQPV